MNLNFFTFSIRVSLQHIHTCSVDLLTFTYGQFLERYECRSCFSFRDHEFKYCRLHSLFFLPFDLSPFSGWANSLFCFIRTWVISITLKCLLSTWFFRLHYFISVNLKTRDQLIGVGLGYVQIDCNIKRYLNEIEFKGWVDSSGSGLRALLNISRISGSHGGEYEDGCLLGCSTV
jgi:hypothetical protein